MKMGNKDMPYPGKFYFAFTQLYLRALSTIDEKQMVLHFKYLRTWVAKRSWSGCITAKNVEFHYKSKSRSISSISMTSLASCKVGTTQTLSGASS